MSRILRIRGVMDRIGKSRSPIYQDIQDGLFPRPVKLGARAAGWPEHEVEAINAARIRGDDAQSIKRLVAKLHAARADVQPIAA